MRGDDTGSERQEGSNGALQVAIAIVLTSVVMVCVCALAAFAWIELSSRKALPRMTPSRQQVVRTPSEAAREWEEYLSTTPLTAAPQTLHTIGIHLLVDEEYRARPHWERDAAALVAVLSEYFQREFGVGFVVESTAPCESDDNAHDLLDLSDSLRSLVSDESEMTLFLTGQSPPQRDYERGYAPYFGRFVTMRPTAPGDSWLYDHETIIHEFGHALGAWHSGSSLSAMRLWKAGGQQFVLGASERAMIEIGLGLELHDGADGINAATLRQIDALMRADTWFRGEHPLAYELYRRAEERMLSGASAASVRADVERADEISVRFPERHNKRLKARTDTVRAWLRDKP